MEKPIYDLIVHTRNPKALDICVQAYGGVVCEFEGIAGNYHQDKDGNYTVRCYGSHDFLRYVIESQGYGTVLSEILVF